MKVLGQPFRLLDAWAVSSQQQSRRNAMIATTRLAHRRAEQIEVDEYLAALRDRTLVTTVSVEHTPVAHG